MAETGRTGSEKELGTPTESDGSCQQHIVGIGASAGGLEALEKIFGSLPTDLGVSYVVVQHLSPDFKSHMSEILSRVTSMPVLVAEDQLTVKSDHVYLIPPRTDLIISGGKLLLTSRSSERVLAHPIDHFFRSLAQDAGRYAIGVVLSGTGSDGTKGTSEIAEIGGLVIAQEPTSAKFDSMPVNAIETGDVHLVLPPVAMGEAIRRYVHEGETPIELREKQLGKVELTGLSRVFELLRVAHGLDFSVYRPNTVERRINRRMELVAIDSLEEYLNKLEEDPEEVNDLYKDLLIGVTKFFRDAEAFEYFEKEVLPNLIERAATREKTGVGQLRIWTCGCATGEEPYSIAMLVAEAIEKSGKQLDFKIFATDAHQQSLQTAAAGIYSQDSIREISKHRRDSYFRERGDRFIVTSSLRRHVVFAPHDITEDPPFTQMDLVVCRNLLIYLQPAVQKKVVSLFHFSLKIGGILFLGPSESLGDLADQFESVHRGWKFHRKIHDNVLLPDRNFSLTTQRELHRNRSVTRDSSPPRREVLPSIYDALLSMKMPPGILVDQRLQLIHAFPGSEQYLRVPTGRPTTNVLDIVSGSLRNSIAAAFQHSKRDDKLVRYTGLRNPAEKSVPLSISVEPIHVSSDVATSFIIQFEESTTADGTTSATLPELVDISDVAASQIEALEQDLSYTQQNLQATIEELESSNEELQAANEEMVAANEELQSTNEELHSVNEELYTVNAEHQKRVRELDEANADMNNLMASTRIGVLFVDNELNLRKFSPVAARMFRLEYADAGRPLSDFLHGLQERKKFIDKIQEVRRTREEVEWESVIEKSAYLVRAIPSWSRAEISGVTIAMFDIERLNQTQRELERFRFMADAHIDAICLVDADANVVYANEQMASRLGYTVEELCQTTVMRFDIEHDMMAFREKFDASKNQNGEIFETTHVRKDGRQFPVEAATTYVELAGAPFLYCIIRDITARRQADEHRRLLEKAVNTVSNGIIISDATQNDLPITYVNPGFEKMTGYSLADARGKNCRFLQGARSSPESIQIMRDAISNEESCRVLVRNYRKNGTAFWNDIFLSPVFSPDGQLTNYVGVQNDVTDSIETAEEIQKKEQTMRVLMDNTAEGIFGIDVQGVCTFANAAAARLLGYESSETLLGRDMHALVMHTRSDGSPNPVERCEVLRPLRDGESVNSREEVFWRADGASFPAEFWSHPICEGVEVTGAVVAFVDSTVRQAELRELRDARIEADLANAAKSLFLANMSHELRTPVAAMLGFTKILQEELSDSDQQERLATIYRNGEHLLTLLGDILDLSKIEAGKLSIGQSVTRLGPLVAGVIETMQVRADEQRVDLKLELMEPLPRTITTDGARVRQILVNLLANAIKFSEEGTVTLKVKGVRGTNKPDQLLFEVLDTGIGISQEQLARLFKPFSQADKTIAHRFGGTGLGLTITQRLVDALNGRIEVESTPNQGSRFTVTLPVAPANHWEKTNATPHESDDDANFGSETELIDPSKLKLNCHVLIADDRRDIRFVAEHFLRKADCEVDTAENGREAADKLYLAEEAGRPFDMVLMDIQMPIMDGVAAVREIRSKGFEVPIIALTADAMKGTRRRLIGEGFDEYLSKPFDLQKLLRTALRLTRGT